MRSAAEAAAATGIMLACFAAFLVIMGILGICGLYALTWVYIHYGDQIINAWHVMVRAWEGFYGYFR